ncbi:hypothetical protein SAMN02910292_02602 [Lachnospiraceae bacterium XBB2008]|nr:hypothetical protein SAMN02910292_02602 [Lachnospiraceae bacterium XBB2008]
MNIRILILIILVAALVIHLVRMYLDRRAKLACTEKTTGYFKYSNEKYGGANKYSKYWNPVYEYSVGNKVYLVEFPRDGKSSTAFSTETEIIYNAQDPEICFALGVRGKIISRYEKEDPDEAYWAQYFDKKPE